MRHTDRRRPSRTLLLVRLALFAVALGCLGWVALRTGSLHLAQQSLRRQLAAAAGGDRATALEPGDLVGRIEIPRVGLDVMVLEGVRDDLLDQGVGHFQETALPGRGDNAAFVGHRDTAFKGLHGVVRGDIVRVTLPWGRFSYTVDSIRVVEPEDVWVLDRTGREVLTLISCHPARWLGPAPQRVVVTALPADVAEEKTSSTSG